MADDSAVTSDLLDRIGRALFGESYKPQLAEALDVSLVTVQRWCSGRALPPATLRHDLLPLIRGRGHELADIERELNGTEPAP